MINSREYLEFLKISKEIMPMLNNEIGADEIMLFEQMVSIRSLYKKIIIEFESYKIYPRHNMSFCYKLTEELDEFMKDSIISSKKYSGHLQLDESCWAVAKHIKDIYQFYYQGIEITKLLKV